MKRSCLDKKHIALVDFNFIYDLKKRIVFNSLFELLGADFTVKTVYKLCSVITVKDIPTFRLSVFTLNTHCVFIVGVHLNGKVFFCVYQLYENREKVEFFTILAENVFTAKLYNLGESLTLVFSVFDNTFAVLMTG